MGEVKSILVALDVDDENKALTLVAQLKEQVAGFKIGSQLFCAQGPSIVKKVRSLGGEVFLDLKFHDIPNTVALAAREAAKLGVFIFNLHASGGTAMMKAAKEAAQEEAAKRGFRPPMVLAVTLLTSLDQEAFQKIFKNQRPLQEQVVHLASLAKEAGLEGVVASPQETVVIRKTLGKDFKIVTPGIRPAGFEVGDQARIMTPRGAKEAGADYLVIGRPIVAAQDPLEASRKIRQELGEV